MGAGAFLVWVLVTAVIGGVPGYMLGVAVERWRVEKENR